MTKLGLVLGWIRLTQSNVYISRTNHDLCPVAVMMAYFAVRGNNPGTLFHFKDGRLLSRFRFVECIEANLARSGTWETPFVAVQQQPPLNVVSMTPLSNFWVGGRAAPIYCTQRPLVTFHFPANSVIYKLKPGIQDNHLVYIVNLCHINILSFLLSLLFFSFHVSSKVTAPQDAHGRLVLQVYLALKHFWVQCYT